MKVTISITCNSGCISFCVEDAISSEPEVLGLIAEKALDICKTLMAEPPKKVTAKCQE